VSRGSGASCRRRLPPCWPESLSNSATKTWSLCVGESFTDVPASQLFYRAIESVLHTGITAGCTATTYCPGDSVFCKHLHFLWGERNHLGLRGDDTVPTTVTREEMARFLTNGFNARLYGP
jgi:hypothetical protein